MTWPWPVPDPLGIQAIDAQAIERADVNSTVALPREDTASPPSPSTRYARSSGEAGPSTLSLSHPVTTWNLLFYVWAAGAIVLLVIEGVRLLRVARAVR